MRPPIVLNGWRNRLASPEESWLAKVHSFSGGAQAETRRSVPRRNSGRQESDLKLGEKGSGDASREERRP